MKKSRLVIFGLLWLGCMSSFSQTTDQIKIIGEVSENKILSLGDFNNFPKTKINGIKITNHAGEFRREYKNLEGVAIADVLQNISITSKSPKFLSEYYLIFKAIDGYSVVFSWNEIFNNDVGKETFIITNIDGKKASELEERILLISTKDFRTGRRHIKGLSTIEVKKI